jgi:hypothetical protein
MDFDRGLLAEKLLFERFKCGLERFPVDRFPKSPLSDGYTI